MPKNKKRYRENTPRIDWEFIAIVALMAIVAVTGIIFSK